MIITFQSAKIHLNEQIARETTHQVQKNARQQRYLLMNPNQNKEHQTNNQGLFTK
jgi:hypothetical protein